MSYSILSVYLLLSASVRHAPFRYRSNPTFRSPASLALSLSRPFFSFSASFFTSFFHSPSSPFFRLSFLSSLLFSRVLHASLPSSLFSLPLPLSLTSHISHLLPLTFSRPPPLLAGLLPSRGGAQGNLTIQGPTVGLAAFYFAAAFFGADFFTAVFLRSSVRFFRLQSFRQLWPLISGPFFSWVLRFCLPCEPGSWRRCP